MKTADTHQQPLTVEAGAGCLGCKRPVPPSGRGDVLVVGEAPGYQEHVQGQPFVGPSGQLLRRSFRQAGIDPDELVFTNLVLCWPGPGNPDPRVTQIKSCAERNLLPLIQTMRPRLIVAVGRLAIKYLTGRTLQQLEGRSVETPHGRVFGLVHPAAALHSPGNLRRFYQQVAALGRLLAPTEDALGVDYRLEMPGAKIALSGTVAIDTETTGLGRGAELLGVSTSARHGRASYYPVPVTVTAQPGATLVFHNAKFDLRHLPELRRAVARGDVDLRDTYLRVALLDYPLRGLKTLALGELGIAMSSYEDVLAGAETLADLSPQSIYRYACADADMTLRLYNKLLADGRVPEEAARLDEQLVPVLLAMEDAGMYIDRHELESAQQMIGERAAQWRATVEQWVDNAGSPKQIARALEETAGASNLRRTKTGQIATDEASLSQVGGPLAEAVREYRGYKKILSFIDGLLRHLDSEGWVHTTFNLGLTKSGRLSSSDPNIENIPQKGELGKLLRACFKAPPGMQFVKIDYDQLELRIMAAMSQEPVLVAAFRDGRDVHAATAQRLFGRETITPEERQLTKTLIYGTVYGGGPGRLVDVSRREGIPLTLEEAREFQEGFAKSLPVLESWRRRLVADIVDCGFSTTWLGRRRDCLGVKAADRETRAAALREGVNHVIQGTASEIVKQAMLRLWRWVSGRGQLVNQVHDEFDLYMPWLLVDGAVPEMHEICSTEFRGVPLTVSIAVGQDWSHGHGV